MQEKRDSKSILSLIEEMENQKAVDTQQGWQQLHRRILISRNKRRLWNWTRNVAAVLLPVFVIWQFAVSPVIRNQAENKMVVVASGSGITQVVLPDSSVVMLNAQSKLTYPEHFTHRTRTVYLDGEGYFTVKADKRKRFNVITRDSITVSAYGTQFNINEQMNGSITEVVLAKGNVDVSIGSHPSSSKTLKVGQMATVYSGSGNITLSEADLYVETAWREGKIIYWRKPLEYITASLSKRFGVDIQLRDDELKNEIFTCTFTTEGVTEILNLLKMAYPIDYTVTTRGNIDDANRKREIIIYKKQ